MTQNPAAAHPIIKQEDRFSETAIDDEVVMMDLQSGAFFALDGTGAAIWRLIDGRRGREAIIADLVDRFSGDAGTVAADVDRFLHQLQDRGFIAGA